jgi:hypothetical protein
MRERTIHVVALRRDTGERVEGTFRWDGLADLWPVEQADGTIAYVSVLDTIVTWEEVTS